jgi:hypothetical protein
MECGSKEKRELKCLDNLPGTEGGRGEKVGEGGRGRNDPNNVCTCE